VVIGGERHAAAAERVGEVADRVDARLGGQRARMKEASTSGGSGAPPSIPAVSATLAPTLAPFGTPALASAAGL
jgi:hypothetical protein